MRTYEDLLNASEVELFAAIRERDSEIERLQTEMEHRQLKFIETMGTCADIDLEQKQAITKLLDALRRVAAYRIILNKNVWRVSVAEAQCLRTDIENAHEVVKEVGG